MNVILTLSLWISQNSLEVFSITIMLSQEEVTFPFIPQTRQTWELQSFQLFPVLYAISHLIGALLGLLQFAIQHVGKMPKLGSVFQMKPHES